MKKTLLLLAVATLFAGCSYIAHPREAAFKEADDLEKQGRVAEATSMRQYAITQPDTKRQTFIPLLMPKNKYDKNIPSTEVEYKTSGYDSRKTEPYKVKVSTK